MAREAPYLISTLIRVNGLVNKFCTTRAADALICRKTAPIAEHRAKKAEAIRADAICAVARRHGAGDMGPATWGRGRRRARCEIFGVKFPV